MSACSPSSHRKAGTVASSESTPTKRATVISRTMLSNLGQLPGDRTSASKSTPELQAVTTTETSWPDLHRPEHRSHLPDSPTRLGRCNRRGQRDKLPRLRKASFAPLTSFGLANRYDLAGGRSSHQGLDNELIVPLQRPPNSAFPATEKPILCSPTQRHPPQRKTKCSSVSTDR